jgi:hypothetical protein
MKEPNGGNQTGLDLGKSNSLEMNKPNGGNQTGPDLGKSKQFRNERTKWWQPDRTRLRQIKTVWK